MEEKEVQSEMVLVNKWVQRLMYSIQLDGFNDKHSVTPEYIFHELGHIRSHLEELYCIYDEFMPLIPDYEA